MSFPQFARAHGVEVGDLIASERIRRCATIEHPRSKNGAYFWDGRRGWVMAWDGDGRTHWYDDPNANPWTEEEKRAWMLRRRVAAATQDRKRENAALQADMLLRSAKVAEHDYLARKGLKGEKGLVAEDGSLLVPMRNLYSNEVQGAQVIKWLPDEMRWEKKMVHGMKAKGAVFRIGAKSAQELCLCEGYATGLSIEMAARQVRLSMAVLVCFSDSNMVHVASLFEAPGGRRIVFADNDKSGAGERAAKATGLPYCMSDVLGEDANDMHVRAGLVPVAGLLMKTRAMA